MKILVEGPDGSGKSTFAKELGKRMGRPLYHAGGPVTNKDELHERIGEQFHFGEAGYIVDRCSVFSEPVYGLILRGKSLLSFEEFTNYIKKMVKDDWYVVYCNGDGEIKKGKEWKDALHMKKVIKNRELINLCYNLMMSKANKLKLNIRGWDFGRHTKAEEDLHFKIMTWEIS